MPPARGCLVPANLPPATLRYRSQNTDTESHQHRQAVFLVEFHSHQSHRRYWANMRLQGLSTLNLTLA